MSGTNLVPICSPSVISTFGFLNPGVKPILDWLLKQLDEFGIAHVEPTCSQVLVEENSLPQARALFCASYSRVGLEPPSFDQKPVSIA